MEQGLFRPSLTPTSSSLAGPLLTAPPHPLARQRLPRAEAAAGRAEAALAALWCAPSTAHLQPATEARTQEALSRSKTKDGASSSEGIRHTHRRAHPHMHTHTATHPHTLTCSHTLIRTHSRLNNKDISSPFLYPPPPSKGIHLALQWQPQSFRPSGNSSTEELCQAGGEDSQGQGKGAEDEAAAR